VVVEGVVLAALLLYVTYKRSIHQPMHCVRICLTFSCPSSNACWDSLRVCCFNRYGLEPEPKDQSIPTSRMIFITSTPPR